MTFHVVTAGPIPVGTSSVFIFQTSAGQAGSLSSTTHTNSYYPEPRGSQRLGTRGIVERLTASGIENSSRAPGCNLAGETGQKHHIQRVTLSKMEMLTKIVDL